MELLDEPLAFVLKSLDILKSYEFVLVKLE